MPTYSYRAKKGPGETVEGELDAESRRSAALALDRMGLSPVWIKEKDRQFRESGRVRTGRIRRRDVTVFTRQLASMIKSGVPILRALSIISAQTPNTGLRRLIEDLTGIVRGGDMLSEGLAAYPDVFPELYVDMIRSGEAGGMLDTALARLAENREKEDETRRRVQSATAYPVLIVTVGIATVLILLIFFLPRITGLFEDYSDLPAPTRALMAVSGFLTDKWYWPAAIIILLWAIVKRLASVERGRIFLDSVKLRIPFIGRMLKWSGTARFARTLALLLEGGVSIDKALDLSSGSLDNSVLRDEILRIRSDIVTKGASLSSGLRKSREFPLFVAGMAAVGEESGRLEESMNEIALFYDREVEHQTGLAVTLLEPALILVVGAIVGFIVAAMLLPIFELSEAL
ncbi:MAG: type II secretion system F family protein [Kiritimatiellia bacterium]